MDDAGRLFPAAAKADNPVLGESSCAGSCARKAVTSISMAAQAKSRLAESRAAQHLTRAALRRLWAPVGSGVLMPTDETRFLVGHLFSDDTGLATAQRIDRPHRPLAGPRGLHLVEKSWPTWPRRKTQQKGGLMLAEIFGMDGVIVLIVGGGRAVRWEPDPEGWPTHSDRRDANSEGPGRGVRRRWCRDGQGGRRHAPGLILVGGNAFVVRARDSGGGPQ